MTSQQSASMTASAEGLGSLAASLIGTALTSLAEPLLSELSLDPDDVADTLEQGLEYIIPVDQMLLDGLVFAPGAWGTYATTFGDRVDWFDRLVDQVIAPYPAPGSLFAEWDREGEMNTYHQTPERTELGKADENASPVHFYDIYSQAIFGSEATGLEPELFQDKNWDELFINMSVGQLFPDLAKAQSLQDLIDAPIPSEWLKVTYNRPRPKSALVDMDAGDFAWDDDYPEAGGKSYVSGHTFGGFLFALPLTWVFPERGEEILSRALQFGESRVVVGAHFPSDTIASRAMMYYYDAQMLQDPQLKAFILDHTQALRQALNSDTDGALQTLLVNAGNPLADAYATDGDAIGYYGQAIADATPGTDPANIPALAANLLMFRFPYLSDTERRDILASTSYPEDSLAGFMLDEGNPDSYWALIDLPNAYRGPTQLDQDMIVNQVSSDDDLTGFGQADNWENNITGPGHLIKEGTGTLTLGGDNAFGGIEVDAGRLILSGDNQLDDTLYIKGGELVVNGDLDAHVVLDGGALSGTGSLSSRTVEDGANNFTGQLDSQVAERLVTDSAALAAPAGGASQVSPLTPADLQQQAQALLSTALS